MPTYSFLNTETGQVVDDIMSLDAREKYLSENPHIETVITGAPGLVGSTGDRTRAPDGFKEVLSKISEANPTSSLASDYGHKDHVSATTRNLVQKHREKLGGSISE
jgi:hypothetical protein